MTQLAAGRQYFLGINGEQTGPFSDEEIAQMWRSGQISDETLLWYEGLEDWKPAGEFLRAVKTGGFTVNATPAPSFTSSISRTDNDETFSTFATKDENVSPVFNDGDAGLSHSFFIHFRLHVYLGTIILVGFLCAGGFYVYTSFFVHKDIAPTAPPPPAKKIDRRDLEYRNAVGDVLLNSEMSLATFVRLVKENHSDEVGKKALESALDHYRRSQRYNDMGRILMIAKRPAEAVKYFLGEQPSYPDALAALEIAYKDKKDQAFLVQQIDLLLGPLNDRKKATDTIRLLETAFPRTPHPYGYYLKTSEEQVVDLFARMAFNFTQSLLGHIESDLPQVHLTKRPLMELKRDKNAGYRITGTYNGDALLSRDLLKGIQFVFWLRDDRWILVETNLTKERSRYAAAEKAKALKEIMSSLEMLSFLETRFRTQFPKSSLHEVVKPGDQGKTERKSEE